MYKIKFRAWDNINKKMIFSLHSDILNQPNWIAPFWHTIENDPDRYTVMQYTGLKDKNNTEIYEGDIIEYEVIVSNLYENPKKTEKQKGIIIRDDKECGFKVRQKNGIVFSNFSWVKTENIVGNIYESTLED